MAKKSRKVPRSEYSGRIINGHSVILASEAEEYLKKMGYMVFKADTVIGRAIKNVYYNLYEVAVN